MCQYSFLPLLWIDCSLSSALLYVHPLVAAAAALTPCNSTLTVALTIPNNEATQSLPSVIKVIYYIRLVMLQLDCACATRATRLQHAQRRRL